MTRYISQAEFWVLAELVTGIETRTLLHTSRVDLADSALQADKAVTVMFAVAARTVDESWLANWLKARIVFSGPS